MSPPSALVYESLKTCHAVAAHVLGYCSFNAVWRVLVRLPYRQRRPSPAAVPSLRAVRRSTIGQPTSVLFNASRLAAFLSSSPPPPVPPPVVATFSGSAVCVRRSKYLQPVVATNIGGVAKGGGRLSQPQQITHANSNKDENNNKNSLFQRVR